MIQRPRTERHVRPRAADPVASWGGAEKKESGVKQSQGLLPKKMTTNSSSKRGCQNPTAFRQRSHPNPSILRCGASILIEQSYPTSGLYSSTESKENAYRKADPWSSDWVVTGRTRTAAELPLGVINDDARGACSRRRYQVAVYFHRARSRHGALATRPEISATDRNVAQDLRCSTHASPFPSLYYTSPSSRTRSVGVDSDS